MFRTIYSSEFVSFLTLKMKLDFLGKLQIQLVLNFPDFVP